MFKNLPRFLFYFFNRCFLLPLQTEMIRQFSIGCMLAAIITLMVHSVIPHHEHENNICFEQIHQETSHKESKKAHACNLENQQIIRKHDDSIHMGCHDGITCDYHFPPIILFSSNFFDFINNKRTGEVNVRYLNLYHSVAVHATNCLRGPPQA